MSPAAYAGTDVPVDRSQQELRGLLRRFGADQFTFGEGRDWAGAEFVHDGHLVRMRCPLRPWSEEGAKALRAATHARKLDPAGWSEHEARRVWRVLVWSIKARLVAVEEGLETFEQAFLSAIVDPASGRTVWEEAREAVEAGALRQGGIGLRELGRGEVGR